MVGSASTNSMRRGTLYDAKIFRAKVDDLFGFDAAVHDHTCHHNRARERVGHYVHTRVIDLVVLEQTRFHFAERDALAVDLHDLVFAAGQKQPTGFVEVADVAGVQPALVVEAAVGTSAPLDFT